jgi:polyhydroxybutyrate depolymerase
MMTSLCLAFVLVAAEPLTSGDHVRFLDFQGQTRSYRLHVPPGYDPGKPTPLVLALHPFALNAASMVQFCGLNAKADQEGFLVVYPEGTGSLPHWNAGDMKAQTADDVGFLAAVLDEVESLATVDSLRVFATGMSNGAMMCYRLASELSDRIAAIAPVGGTMAIAECRNRRPVPVLQIHGTRDRLVPFEGPGEKPPAGMTFRSVPDSIRAWVVANGCPETPEITQLPDLANDGMTVRRERYAPGREGSEVVLYRVEGGGHTWPGRQAIGGLLGKSTRDIDANDLIWAFFQRHPLR